MLRVVELLSSFIYLASREKTLDKLNDSVTKDFPTYPCIYAFTLIKNKVVKLFISLCSATAWCVKTQNINSSHIY